MATDSSDVPAPLPQDERALIHSLRNRLADSLLPGEPSLPDERLDEAAAFLFEAARQRADGAHSLLIRSARNGHRFSRIAIVNDDMPFLVDSVAAILVAQGLSIDRLIHPIVRARRDAAGRLVAISPSRAPASTDSPISETGPDRERPKSERPESEQPESMIYLETARMEARARRALEQALVETLDDVRAAVSDLVPMRDALEADARRLGEGEGSALLRWLSADMATHVGHLTRHRDGTRGQLLGICRRDGPDLLSDDSYERAFAWFDRDRTTGGGAAKDGGETGRELLIVKANRLSRVHRRVPLDLVIAPVIEGGRVVALSVHAGMWTSAALNAPPDQVPVLRRQLAQLMTRLSLSPGSHAARALAHALTVLPRDVLIGFAPDDLARVATAAMALSDRPRPRVALVAAPLGRHLFAFVWLPRDLLTTAVRLQIQTLLEEASDSRTIDWGVLIEGGALAMVRYVLDLRDGGREPDEGAVDAQLQELLRGWADAVEQALVDSGEDAGRAAALATRWADSFPLPYRTAHGPAEAARDIGRMRHLGAGDADDPQDTEPPLQREVRLYRDASEPTDQLRLKIYQLGGSMPLSDAVPALENFGFVVLAEMPTELIGPAAEPEPEPGVTLGTTQGTIHDFSLGLTPGDSADALLDRAETIEAAVRAVVNGRAENDLFNRLVTNAGLDARAADWLRAINRYLRQGGSGFTIQTVVDALRGAPMVTRALVALFEARHDPAFEGDREAATAEAGHAIRDGLAQVAAINDDRLLRLYHGTIDAMLRTNAFAPAGREALAFKFDSARVPGLPRPLPWREIFVHSQRVEGIHLRAGAVARGGLRWSDRRDDFRTETLGLMKTQRVKNAVIVPSGAKGGFYAKQLPSPAADRDAWFAEGRESYKTFIRALLSVTDNIVDDKTVHPDAVVIHDGADPYLVVAADKGTATFSDTANAIAAEHDFWLRDAFASGGSNGYDHKTMGITARGAWLSVQRHFREMGLDVQTEPVRVVGCGDMSGDVFGNGMLLSKTIRLIAAFDHRHIFIDPGPDPQVSWEERKRLFDLPRSSWADYAEQAISTGGGVYARTEKSITLSAEAREALGIADETLEPEALIAAILKSPVDLIWFGGIGTYVKAGGESHADVGDPANDAVRASAGELRARVIGEGANLGMTQAARIEFALGGGRINADFIDNSGGVDCSDNEVNIKIALAGACRAGALSESGRNALLAQMTDEVAALVLETNRQQALALSIARRRGPGAVPALLRLMETLEEDGGLDRHAESLADNVAFTRRAGDGEGLTRPELAVLLSHATLMLQSAIEHGALAGDAAAEPLLLANFPEQMRDRFAEQILAHPLRTEIVATVVANRIVDRMGLVHPFELAEEEGAGLARVAAAFVAASRLLDMDDVWAAIDTRDMPEEARLALFAQTALALRGHVADLLRAGNAVLAPSRVIEVLGGGVGELASHVDDLLANEARQHAETIAGELVDCGAPEDLAARVATLFALDGAIGLAHLSRETGIPPLLLTNGFIALGERLRLDWAQTRATVMSPAEPWERLLVAGLARDFQQMRFDFLRHLAQDAAAGEARPCSDPAGPIEDWLAEHDEAISRFGAMVDRARHASTLTPAMLAQIASQARNLLQRRERLDLCPHRGE